MSDRIDLKVGSRVTVLIGQDVVIAVVSELDLDVIICTLTVPAVYYTVAYADILKVWSDDK